MCKSSGKFHGWTSNIFILFRLTRVSKWDFVRCMRRRKRVINLITSVRNLLKIPTRDYQQVNLRQLRLSMSRRGQRLKDVKLKSFSQLRQSRGLSWELKLGVLLYARFGESLINYKTVKDEASKKGRKEEEEENSIQSWIKCFLVGGEKNQQQQSEAFSVNLDLLHSISIGRLSKFESRKSFNYGVDDAQCDSLIAQSRTNRVQFFILHRVAQVNFHLISRLHLDFLFLRCSHEKSLWRWIFLTFPHSFSARSMIRKALKSDHFSLVLSKGLLFPFSLRSDKSEEDNDESRSFVGTRKVTLEDVERESESMDGVEVLRKSEFSGFADWFMRVSETSSVKDAKSTTKTKKFLDRLFDDKEISRGIIFASGLWKYWFLLLSLKTRSSREARRKMRKASERMKNSRE